ncbi:putative inositol-pentakisphosphate 2-kinase [Triangularia setosa]|uniref:Inositol-pentakisphosphate 2-kinase n=1 Tax=Triangularia setosa TaxID=2587417 RepID=A0AAN6WCT7_9PEZI|nr:putative inositol-pentakisphosphate 2-kinase [Podospora setosa]
MSQSTSFSSDHIPDISDFSPERWTIKFVNEGAANLVFEVRLPPSPPSTTGSRSNGSNDIFQGNLLRVPKAGAKTFPYPELQQYWESTITPLFPPENLAQHQLVKLGHSPSKVVALLNDILIREESGRRKDFRGTRVLPDAQYGMLIEDMRSQNPSDLFVEFKPKWLSPSPSQHTRCRNCAREAYRDHLDPSHHKAHRLGILCPLDFIACRDSLESLDNVLKHILPASSSPSQRTRLIHWLKTNTLLPALQKVQSEHDPSLGVNLELAMTLRDCSLFLRISSPEEGPGKVRVDAKLADLDKKNAAKKKHHWEWLERNLVEGGFYGGKETPREKTYCLLERSKRN